MSNREAEVWGHFDPLLWLRSKESQYAQFPRDLSNQDHIRHLYFKASADELELLRKLEAACREWREVYDPEHMVADAIVSTLNEIDARGLRRQVAARTEPVGRWWNIEEEERQLLLRALAIQFLVFMRDVEALDTAVLERAAAFLRKIEETAELLEEVNGRPIHQLTVHAGDDWLAELQELRAGLETALKVARGELRDGLPR